jgi:hypothetical protein
MDEKEAWKEIKRQFYFTSQNDEPAYLCNTILRLKETGVIDNSTAESMRDKVMSHLYFLVGPCATADNYVYHLHGYGYLPEVKDGDALRLELLNRFINWL